ncbi:TPA: protein translocase SEC61 complex subunit gamma [Candidatus Woesearchaeota archaeon]|nr:protein translocase SEC61 complex subunit gamma [Candidatus Woesearchaeota archaeon]
MPYEDENNQEAESREQQDDPQDKHTHLQTHQHHTNQHTHHNPHQARYQQHLQEKAQQQGTTEQKESAVTKFKSFTKECVRVLRITKKPTGIEFKTIVKVSGIGMLLIGLLGFIIQLIRQVLISF